MSNRKSTGVVRRVDELGRIVLPKELRKTMNILEKDPVEIYVEDNCIILNKYAPVCIFCGGADNLTVFHGRNICKHCLELLRR